jgi:hypothetical protein
MAGQYPFFITGANAKIKVNGKTMAFCTNLSYSIQVNHQAPHILGLYEPTSVEPLSYAVTGSFSVIRYAKDAVANHGGKKPDGIAANDAGNSVGNWGGMWGGKLGDLLARNGIGNDGRANEALDPSKFDNGVGFDIQVYQKTPGGDLGVANIRNARIIRASFNIQKRGPAIETYEFMAMYVDEDAFVADISGKGQQFT